MKSVPATLFVIATCLSVAQAEPAVTARSEFNADMLGSWSFSTDRYANGICQMTGTLTVFPGQTNANGLECELTAVEDCGFGRSVVAQTCQITADNTEYLLESEIVEFFERMPNVMGVYMPDHFIISDVTGDEMHGRLVSASTAAAIFVRDEGNIS